MGAGVKEHVAAARNHVRAAHDGQMLGIAVKNKVLKLEVVVVALQVDQLLLSVLPDEVADLAVHPDGSFISPIGKIDVGFVQIVLHGTV